MSNRLSRYRTRVDVTGPLVRVFYVKTLIVYADGENVTLDNGGWQTATTKQKMTAAAAEFGLGFTVFQRKGEWFVCRLGRSPEGSPSAAPEHGAIVLPYRNGMTFPRGTVRPVARAA